MIEFQYFDGCPNSDATLKNLMELVTLNVIKKEAIKIIEVSNIEDAEKMNFQGSPSILVNGIDIYTGKKPESYAYSCRVYIIDGVQTGILSKEYIRSKVLKLR